MAKGFVIIERVSGVERCRAAGHGSDSFVIDPSSRRCSGLIAPASSAKSEHWRGALGRHPRWCPAENAMRRGRVRPRGSGPPRSPGPKSDCLRSLPVPELLPPQQLLSPPQELSRLRFAPPSGCWPRPRCAINAPHDHVGDQSHRLIARKHASFDRGPSIGRDRTQSRYSAGEVGAAADYGGRSDQPKHVA